MTKYLDSRNNEGWLDSLKLELRAARAKAYETRRESDKRKNRKNKSRNIKKE